MCVGDGRESEESNRCMLGFSLHSLVFESVQSFPKSIRNYESLASVYPLDGHLTTIHTGCQQRQGFQAKFMSFYRLKRKWRSWKTGKSTYVAIFACFFIFHFVSVFIHG